MSEHVKIAETIAKFCGWQYDEEAEVMFVTEEEDIVGYDWPSMDAIIAACNIAHKKEDHWAECYLGHLADVMMMDAHGEHTLDPSAIGRYELLVAPTDQRIRAFIKAIDCLEMKRCHENNQPFDSIVKTADSLPLPEDADSDGNVLAFDAGWQTWVKKRWWDFPSHPGLTETERANILREWPEWKPRRKQ